MDADIKYIAGFFDGEGSVGIYKNSSKKYPGFYLRTQITQNKGKEVEGLMLFLKNAYGGNLGEQKTLSSGIKYNWQLGSDSAVRFLEDIKPYLILKKKQAEIAIAWQKQRPARVRDSMGRIRLKTPANIELDTSISKLMKELKKGT